MTITRVKPSEISIFTLFAKVFCVDSVKDANKEGKFEVYTSQYGFQVQMFNHLRNMGFENVNHLKSLTAFLMAVVVLGLTITIPSTPNTSSGPELEWMSSLVER